MAPPNHENSVVGKISLQQMEEANESNRPSKRPKDGHVVSAESSRSTSPTVAENYALLTCLVQLFCDIPDSLLTTSGDTTAFRKLWTRHGFRTSLITSPHEAVSIFLDSCKQTEEVEGKEGRSYLLSCIGMQPQQRIMEQYYATIMSAYCLHLFFGRMRVVRKQLFDTDDICGIIMSWETELKDVMMVLKDDHSYDRLKDLAGSSSRILSELITKLGRVDHTLRTDQLLREYNRITYENCTLTNACLQKLLYRSDQPHFELDEVHFHCSPVGSYISNRERITIRMKDENAHALSSRLILMPSLANNILLREDIHRHPLDGVVEDMLNTTWDDLLRNGYYVDQKKKEQLLEPLKMFFLSGLLGGRESNMPILLNAHFTPTYPLSLYIWGTAGAGKSSLVRNLFPAMNSAINKHCDPELMVRFVKQNLNKPFETLKLELDLRPNNNDYSVMSIIQGRRMTLSQSKPGLVLVGLEEMPSNTEGMNPNQFDVSKLISMRFSGRKGEFKNGNAPKNSAKRGISGDPTIITIFTSNYDLEQPCLEALHGLEMFQNLHMVQMTSVGGQDRALFANSYLAQRVNDSLASWKGKLALSLNVPLGEGDTRPLVKYLRMLSFYIQALVVKSQFVGHIDVSVTFDDMTNTTNVITSVGENIQLKASPCGNIYATAPTALDSRATETVQSLHKRHPDLKSPSELCQILDFYFAKTLAPAVVLSNNKQLVEDLMKLLSHSKGVKAILDVDPSSRKIMKSLYDSSDTPNLRDDIIDMTRGNADALVAIELMCNNTDAQMQIREIIEDTPSMTAFSTERSALCKDGLFFGIYVNGPVTPEIKSRASLVI